MAKSFEGCRQLIAWAREHHSALVELQTQFVQAGFRAVFTEREGDRLLAKVKVPDLNSRLPLLIFDIVNSLRSALDHAVYDSALALGENPEPLKTKFPVGKSRETVGGQLKNIPAAIHSLILNLEPYPGGKSGIWMLNELRNQKVHRMLQPMALGSVGTMTSTQSSGRYRMLYDCSVWDESQGVLTFAVFDAEYTTMKIEEGVRPNLTISLGEPFYGHNVAELFNYFISTVETFVESVKAETAAAQKRTD